MKGLLAFGLVMGLILLGLGLWTATPMGGGGLGDEGGAGRDLQDHQEGPSRGVVPQDRDGVAQDDSDSRVEIREGDFAPSTVEVPPRSTVTFLNRDDVARGIDFADPQLPDARIRVAARTPSRYPAAVASASPSAGTTQPAPSW